MGPTFHNSSSLTLFISAEVRLQLITKFINILTAAKESTPVKLYKRENDAENRINTGNLDMN